jgi:hypothetical protein
MQAIARSDGVCGDVMLEMLELSSRAASSAKLDCRQRAAMRVSEASHDRCRPTHHLQIDPESAALFKPYV